MTALAWEASWEPKFIQIFILLTFNWTQPVKKSWVIECHLDFFLLNEEIRISLFFFLCERLVSYSTCQTFPVVHKANLSFFIAYFHFNVENDT